VAEQGIRVSAVKINGRQKIGRNSKRTRTQQASKKMKTAESKRQAGDKPQAACIRVPQQGEQETQAGITIWQNQQAAGGRQ